MPAPYTLIWQYADTPLRDWYMEIFGPYIGNQIVDGEHKVVCDNAILADSYLHAHPLSYYQQFRGLNVFLLESPDEYLLPVSDRYACFRGVFRGQWSAAYRPQRVLSMPVGYIGDLHQAKLNPKRASQRRYRWSFLGQINKATRPEVVRGLAPFGPHYWHSTDGFHLGSDYGQGPANYASILSETAFCPCPMGNVHQETHRVWEALEAGCIPVVEKTAWMDAHHGLLGSHPLPTYSSWSHAARDLAAISASSSTLDALQLECSLWWRHKKQDLLMHVGSFMAALEVQPPASPSEFRKSWANLPAWNYLELMRHHTARAFGRRLRRQANRVFTRGKLLERYTPQTYEKTHPPQPTSESERKN